MTNRTMLVLWRLPSIPQQCSMDSQQLECWVMSNCFSRITCNHFPKPTHILTAFHLEFKPKALRMLVSFILNMIRICTVDASHACFKDLMHLQAASFCSLTGHTIIQDVTGTVSKIRQLHLTVSYRIFILCTWLICIVLRSLTAMNMICAIVFGFVMMLFYLQLLNVRYSIW